MTSPEARFVVRFYNAEAAKEYKSLDGSSKKLVDVGLAKLRTRADEIGKPLRGPFAGCKELKYRDVGIRVIFRITEDAVEVVSVAEVVAIGPRDKGKVFDIAEHRLRPTK